jgi:hypothetical protein
VAPTIQANGVLIGKARAQRFLRDCGNDLNLAEQVCDWNVRMSGALYESLHTFEIVLRNAMDGRLATWNASVGYGRDWLITPDPRLDKLLNQGSLKTARGRADKAAKRRGRPLVHDDILAQMSLATWRYLLPSHTSVPKQRLWTDALEKAFPRWFGPWETLADKVDLAYQARNRVAHLESLHGQDLRAIRRSMRQVSDGISFRAGRLLRANDRTLPLIEELEALNLP